MLLRFNLIETYSNLAKLLIKRKWLDEVIRFYLKAIELFLGNFVVYCDLGRIYKWQGKLRISKMMRQNQSALNSFWHANRDSFRHDLER